MHAGRTFPDGGKPRYIILQTRGRGDGAAKVRAFRPGRRNQANFLKIRLALCPPNPKELDSTARTSLSTALLGT